MKACDSSTLFLDPVPCFGVKLCVLKEGDSYSTRTPTFPGCLFHYMLASGDCTRFPNRPFGCIGRTLKIQNVKHNPRQKVEVVMLKTLFFKCGILLKY
ncbi:unnamed protein product [Nesidiocoris tenuis]|uniref:Uncharacterized protein n=1 Tax=Nesidiocoris tenuis TaxID=355587 RepID=A0A6H5HND2_9HEMI|nr:unnamed protein product [Nesidiocoris tenuis]